MATYYIAPAASGGSDANNGLGPDASHASNKPFATLGKVIAASGVGAAGDVVYMAPGTYRATTTVGISSPASDIQILGDPTNAQGFKNGSGVRLAQGEVILTAYTTNDTTAAAAAAVLNLAGRDHLRFENLILVGGHTQVPCVDAQTAISTDITFRQCVFLCANSNTNQVLFWIVGSTNTALNWTIDRCVFGPSRLVGIYIQLPTLVGADYDANVQVQNCLAIGTGGNGGGPDTFVRVEGTGASANKGGGVDVTSCTVIGASLLSANNATVSTTIPCTATNNIVIGAGVCLLASTLGQITEDFNDLIGSSPRTNVTAGGNSRVAPNVAPLLQYLYWMWGGWIPRPFGTPMSGSPFLGSGTATGTPTVDLWNRPRPAGGEDTDPAKGALERHDTATQETATTDAGSTGLVITGPGDHEFWIPVNASSTTLSIKGRYDTNHGTTNKPQAILFANPDIGVNAETLTMSAAADTWETLTFSAFTPSAAGILRLRLVSRAGAGNGKAFFDTADVPDISTEGFGHFLKGEPFPAITGSAAGGGGGGIKLAGRGGLAG